MTPEVRKELDDLTNIVSNWIDCEVRLADCDGTDGFLIDDFIEDIAYQVTPYVRRLRECGHITTDEFADFITILREKVTEFRRRLNLPEEN